MRLILSGTSGSGKTSVARKLAGAGKFEHARAVTTRAQREDDSGEYEYLTTEEFIALRESSDLLTDVEYRGFHYGIKVSEVERIERTGAIALFTITPESAAGLVHADETGLYISFFIDTRDEELDRRIASRGQKHDQQEIVKQRQSDRTYREHFTYVLDNRDLKHTLEFIVAALRIHERSGVITSRILRLGIKCGVYVERGRDENIQGASYDLSLGDEYFYGGKIRRLSERDPILIIEPYDYAIVTTDEIGNLPLNCCGRFDLSVSLFTQGVILSNGPQVDPGFRGPLFCLLFNTSSSPVLLKRGSHYATLEIHQLIESAPGYRGKYQRKTLLDYLPQNASRGAINELKREVENLRDQSRSLQTVILGVISIFMAMIALWVSLK